MTDLDGLAQGYFDLAQAGYKKVGWPAEAFLGVILVIGILVMAIALLPFVLLGFCIDGWGD